MEIKHGGASGKELEIVLNNLAIKQMDHLVEFGTTPVGGRITLRQDKVTIVAEGPDGTVLLDINNKHADLELFRLRDKDIVVTITTRPRVF